MMNSMTGQAQDFKIFYGIILPVSIYMMYFKLTVSFLASITTMRKFFKSNLSITGYTGYKSRIFIPFWFVDNKMIKTLNFFILTFFRTMLSMYFTWTHKKIPHTFITSHFNFVSCVEIMKTSFTAKNIPEIFRSYLKIIQTLFAGFRFSGFGNSFSIAVFTAIFLPLVIAGNSLIASNTFHVCDVITNTITSQPLTGV